MLSLSLMGVMNWYIGVLMDLFPPLFPEILGCGSKMYPDEW